MKSGRSIVILVVAAFTATLCGPLPQAGAQEFLLPRPGTMVPLSPAFSPALLKGIKVHQDNPFRFDFVMNPGNTPPVSLSSGLDSPTRDQLRAESAKLIRYFLAALTVPEKDLWVNLSPYEKDRIVPGSFGKTEMGRDLLAEDYMLKQVTASLIYPEDATGKIFWKRIYEEAAKRFGTTNVPVNTFNKVWIVPDKAVVYENVKAGTAYVVESRLKVMLEQDYLSLKESLIAGHAREVRQWEKMVSPQVAAMGSQIVREVVIPQLEKEVNMGKNFSQLRQIYNSLILAAWYKKKIKDSILAQVYNDKNKIKGTEYERSVIEAPQTGRANRPPNDALRIYARYLEAFKKGAYNLIKEEQDPVTRQMIPRKYFSGGVKFGDLDGAMTVSHHMPPDSAMTAGDMEVAAGLRGIRRDGAMVSKQKLEQSVNLLTATLDRLRHDKDLPIIYDLGDKHGHMQDLKELYEMALAYKGARPIVIVVHGDIFDRGKRIRENLNYLVRLKRLEERPGSMIKLVATLGNHEEMLLNAYLDKFRFETMTHDEKESYKEEVMRWFRFGGSETFEQIERGSSRRDELEDGMKLKYGTAPTSFGTPNWLERFYQLQYNEFLSSDLLTLANVVQFILNHFDLMYVDAWGYGAKHNMYQFDIYGTPRADVARWMDVQKEWVAAARGGGDRQAIENVLRKVHNALWTSRYDEIGSAFYPAGELDENALDDSLAEFGVVGMIYGHEAHGLQAVLPGEKNRDIMNVGNWLFGIDMLDGQGGPGGRLIRDPDRGIYFKPLGEPERLVISKEDYIARMELRKQRLEKQLADMSGPDSAMLAEGSQKRGAGLGRDKTGSAGRALTADAFTNASAQRAFSKPGMRDVMTFLRLSMNGVLKTGPVPDMQSALEKIDDLQGVPRAVSSQELSDMVIDYAGSLHERIAAGVIGGDALDGEIASFEAFLTWQVIQMSGQNVNAIPRMEREYLDQFIDAFNIREQDYFLVRAPQYTREGRSLILNVSVPEKTVSMDSKSGSHALPIRIYALERVTKVEPGTMEGLMGLTHRLTTGYAFYYPGEIERFEQNVLSPRRDGEARRFRTVTTGGTVDLSRAGVGVLSALFPKFREVYGAGHLSFSFKGEEDNPGPFAQRLELVRSKMTAKAYAFYDGPGQRARVVAALEGITVRHEAEHVRRFLVKSFAPEETVRPGFVSREETLAELASGLRLDNPWLLLAHLVDRTVKGQDYGWSILGRLAGIEQGNHEAIVEWLERVAPVMPPEDMRRRFEEEYKKFHDEIEGPVARRPAGSPGGTAADTAMSAAPVGDEVKLQQALSTKLSGMKKGVAVKVKLDQEYDGRQRYTIYFMIGSKEKVQVSILAGKGGIDDYFLHGDYKNDLDLKTGQFNRLILLAFSDVRGEFSGFRTRSPGIKSGLASFRSFFATYGITVVDSIWDSKLGQHFIEATLTPDFWRRLRASHGGDEAMASRVSPGGIDLTANKTPLDIQSSGPGGITFKMDPAMLREFRNAPGFEPVIINIQPLRDLPLFLGAKDVSSVTPAV